MDNVDWAQTPNAQQATQLYDASTVQASGAETPAETSDSQPAESDFEVSTAWLSDLVQELINTQVKTSLKSVLLPRTREIEEEVSTMQQEAATVTSKSKEEQAEVEEELARMAKLVFAFQSHISQFLPEGMVTTTSSDDPATPE
ncbi:hypothetical protein ABBQ38_004318 [Trebouxia sp. C0009 RCD-2024]